MADQLMAYQVKDGMEPIVLLNYYVQIKTYNSTVVFGQVDFLERIPWFQAIDMGAIPVQAFAAKQNVINLDLWDGEFGQWRWYPLDDAQVSVFVPAGVSKWQLKNLTVGIDRSIILRDPSLESTEIFTWQDQRPAMQALNFSNVALTACRIMATGYRFHYNNVTDPAIIKQLNSGALRYTTIQCAGQAGVGIH
jgi:hypothetical protein